MVWKQKLPVSSWLFGWSTNYYNTPENNHSWTITPGQSPPDNHPRTITPLNNHHRTITLRTITPICIYIEYIAYIINVGYKQTHSLYITLCNTIFVPGFQVLGYISTKAYGKTTTFSTNFDFYDHSTKNRIYCDKPRKFLYCRSCGLIKKQHLHGK